MTFTVDPVVDADRNGADPHRADPNGANRDDADALGLRGLFGRRRRRPWGLRRRILATFLIGATMLAMLLAGTTYGLASSNVVQQREEAAVEATRRNARTVQTALRGPAPTAQPAVDALSSFGVQRALIWYRDSWTAGSGRYQADALPQPLVDRVIDDAIPSYMVADVDGEPNIVVGWPLANDAAYFEFFSLDEVSSTLQSVRLSLILAGAITIVLAVITATIASRRAVRPVGAAARAAKSIAGGRLDTRLDANDDPDLAVLSESFNDMAAALQARIERDARFASDVSHELRSPLMTLAGSIELIQARRDDLPERAREAVDLLSSDVARFRTLVEDLLEISRFDAGAVTLHTDELLLTQFVTHAVSVSSLPSTPVVIGDGAENLLITADRRRLARVVANLIDNARLHGGGDAEVRVEVPAGGRPVAQIRVEDHGPGVPHAERRLVFERFARGGGAGRRAGNDGSGLGLALVAEHVRLHGGRVWVTDRADRTPGAAFIVELPAEDISDELNDAELAP